METTYFAPSGRADEKELLQQRLSVSQAKFMSAVLHSVTDMMLVLNEQRQIIATNKKFLDALGITDPSSLLGLRPGEAVHCIHSDEGPDGCGTAGSCSACGAVLAILASRDTGEQSDGECRLVIDKNGGTALDLAVKTTPLDVDGYVYTLTALKDIGSEKRRQVLEHTFFHDILNTVGGIRGIADLLADRNSLTPEEEIEYKEILIELSDTLAEEIGQQRRLLAAERGEYLPEMESVELRELLQEVCGLYRNHSRTPGRTVVLEASPECHLITDRAMLRRIVGNMVLNALEAVPAGAIVRIALEVTDAATSIMVTNPGEIEKDTQLQLFKRSFSTKSASGRGIGTYSMKLFGERYLGGTVGFRSAEGETMFFIRFARNGDKLS